jgi:hypothetical protein
MTKSINAKETQETPIISDQILFGELDISDYNYFHHDHADLWAENFDVKGIISQDSTETKV